MSELTTAQRLSAYYAELLEEEFTEDVVEEALRAVMPRHIEDLVVKADVEDDGTPVAEVRVHMRPELNEEDVARVAEEIQRRAEIGQRFLGQAR